MLAELDYFLREHRSAMRRFTEDLRRGAFLYAPPTDAQLDRAMAVEAAYPELGLGLVDGTIVALAEELDIVRLATRDVRDFQVVRLRDGRAFDLVVAPAATQDRRRRRG